MYPGDYTIPAELPESKLRLIFAVREIVLSSAEDIGETRKWGRMTFTYRDEPIAFICSSRDRDFIELGFFKGDQLTQSALFLKTKVRSVRRIRIDSPDNIPVAELMQCVREALALCAGGEKG